MSPAASARAGPGTASRPRGVALAAAAWLASYVYGSLPVVYLLGRQGNVDLRTIGSGNVGGSNLWTAGGAARGVTGWLADASKGLLPIAVCRRLGFAPEVADVAGVCGLAGQCWPLFLRFSGGRGISPFVGAALAMRPASWAVTIAPLIGGSLWRVAATRLRPTPRTTAPQTSRSKSVPLGCFLGVVIFLLASRPHSPRSALAPTLLSAAILLRRLTAPLPDDATQGPRVRRRALLYRLLYDRNTSD